MPLYEMVPGQPLFQAPTPILLMLRQLREDPPVAWLSLAGEDGPEVALVPGWGDISLMGRF